jgi:hypothetical protein
MAIVPVTIVGGNQASSVSIIDSLIDYSDILLITGDGFFIDLGNDYLLRLSEGIEDGDAIGNTTVSVGSLPTGTIGVGGEIDDVTFVPST